MLKTVIALGLVVAGYSQTTEDPSAGCWDFMEPQETYQSAENPIMINYVNHLITGFVLPLALDECTAASLVSAGEGTFMFTCSEDGMTMTRRHYTDAGCTIEGDAAYSWMVSDYNATSRDEWYFQCGGETYATEVEVSAGVPCAQAEGNMLTMHAAVSACAGNTEYDVNAYCDADGVRIQFFAPGSYCTDPWLCRGNDTDTTCGEWFDTSIARVYGNMVSCNVPGIEGSTESPSPEDSAFGISAMVAGFVGLLVAAYM